MRKRIFRVIVLLVMLSVTASAQIYVSPTGDDANPGTIDLPFKTLTKAMAVAGPDSLIYMRGGTYSISSTVTTPKSGLAGQYIKVWAYPGETPVLDFSSEPIGSRGIQISANYWYFKGLEIKNAGDNGIYITGGHNKVEQCVIHGNQDSGMQISGGGNNNVITNCDSYLNYDSATHGGNADGFAPKLDVGPGNEFHGCRSWNNSDDGWDCYGSNYGTVIESCWTFRNGINVWGDAAFAGNGNGFKVGGNYTIAAHTVTNCVAFDNAVKGFDQNHNAGGVIVSNCTAWRNQRSYWFPDTLRSGENVIKNNISFQTTSTPTSFNTRFTEQAANSWQGFTVTTADFLSLDTSLATAPRNPDGSLPSNGFLHLASGSTLIDAGVYAWIPYNGTAPDLGAFETPGPAAPKFTLSVNATNGSVTKNPDFAQYDSGAAVPCTAVPSDGYYFVSWADSLTGAQNPDTILMNGNKTVTANFAVIVGLTGSFRTHRSGNWSDVASWERFDGSAWINPAPTVPTSSDGTITILGGHAITVDINPTVDQVVVDANASIIVAAGKTLTIADGVDSVDMVVNGTLNNYGTVTPTGRLSFENGGLYIHSVPSGGTTLPSSTWRVGSTCRIDSSSGSSPTNLSTQALYNLTWNATSQGANGGPNFADGAVIYGDLTVTSTQGFQWRIVNLSGGQTKNVYIRGNIYVNGSTALLTATGSGADTSAKAAINVDGGVTVSAGQWSLNNSSAAYTEWKVKGDINVTGGTLQSGSSGWYGRRTLNFVGGGTQAFTVSAPGTIGTAPTTFKVSNNSVVQVNFPWTLMASGGLSLAGGQFITTSVNLITVPANGSVTGGSSSSYVNGPLALIVASSSPTVKTFPVGKGTSYRPLTLSVNQDASTATTYTAEVFNTAPAARSLPPALSAVSSIRYYHIAKGAGANLSPTLGATVQLSYDTDDLVTNATILRVAKDDGAGNWINAGGSGTANTTGSITSNAFFSFSDFVLATADTSIHAVLPTVTTTAMSYISTTFASSGGNITDDGGAAVTARGVCWNTAGSPTILNSKTSDGTGAGIFTSSLTGLTPGAGYHVRAYATNSAGTGYGNEVIFSTLASLVPPTVTTTSISGIQVTTAIGGGNVTDWGGDSVTARGVCWGTTNSPTLSGNHSVDGSGLGSFASGLSPLAGGTKYYVRAYATNSAGTGYGDTVSFATQTPANDTTVVVAKDGSGNYTTVQAAFRAVPANFTGKWTIFVRKGTYYEKDTLVSGKINVVLTGEDRDSTIITYDDYADRYGSGNPGTSGSFTIAVDASDFTAKNITFRNTYAPQSGVTGTQAVALRTQGDRHEYVNCKILGYQDTYYTWGGSATGRQYHKNCYIEGSVDFIFGRNIVVFDSCTIHEIRNGGTVTAGSTDATSRYGYVFRNCTILADSVGYDGNPLTSFYLGRPWQGSPRTVFLNCSEPSNLNVSGWLAWNVTPALYAEYNCLGPGSSTSGRVAWSSQLAGPAAAAYSLSNIFARSSAVSSLILYDWMPASAGADQPLLLRITASAGAHGSITPPGVASVAYGGGQTYSLIPDAGYHVTDVLVDGVSVGSTAGYTFTNVTANRTISSTFAINTYTLTVNATHGTVTVSPPAGPYDSATVVHLTAIPATGYHFVNWSDSLTGTHNPDSIVMNRNKIVTAHFAINTYSLTVNAAHGTVTMNPPTGPYDSASVVHLTAIPATGYHFVSWSDSLTGTANLDSLVINGNKVVTAHFAINTYALTINATHGTVTLSPPAGPYDSATVVHLTAVPATGYHFVNWTDSLTSSHNPDSIFMNNNKVITGNFAINTYALQVMATHGSVVKNPDQARYDSNSTVELFATPATGYYFVGWTDSLTGTMNPDTVVMNGNKTITANFGTRSYSLTVNERWNILSVPCIAADMRKSLLFPYAISKAFAYAAGYFAKDTLVTGAGYWLKFPAKETVMIAGVDRVSDTIPVNAGWNIIGSISVPVRVGSIASIPPRIVAGNFFGYESKYIVSDTVYPLKGYWVKVNQAGSLILSGTRTGLTASARIRIVPTSEMPPAPPGLGPSDGGAIPSGYSLDRNYPNPFNPSTTIVAGVPRAGWVRLVVYDILGREVRTLLDEERSAGYHTIEWNGLTDEDAMATSGIYFVRMTVEEFSAVEKIVLMK